MALELPDGWRDQLPDDIKTSGVLDDVKTIDQMATMIVNGRKLQSRQISIPTADASDDERKTFYRDLQSKIPDLVYVGEGAEMDNIYDRMGRPEAPDKYKMGDVPDPLKDNFAKLAETAHKSGLTQAQMEALGSTIIGDYEASVNTHAARMEEQKKAIDSLYGEAKDERLKSIAEFAEKIGFDDSLVDAVREGIVSVDNLKALEKTKLGFKSPGPRIGDETGADDFTHLTPTQAKEQLDQLMSNREHAYWDASRAGHKEAVDKVVELNRQILAGQS